MHYDSISEPQPARRYFATAESNGERFVMESRQQTRRFDSLEYHSIFACSRLLSILGFAFYRTHRANGVSLSDAAAWRWLHLVRGVKIVFTASIESGVDIDPIMSQNMTPEIPQSQGSCSTPTSSMQGHRMHRHFYLVQETQGERF